MALAVVVDSTFGSNSQGNVVTSISSSDFARINAIALQSDGKIVAVGSYNNSVNNLDNIVVCRYNQSGTLDTTFGSNNTGIVLQNFTSSSNAYGVALQTDGKIIVVGYTFVDGVSQMLVLRYTSTGSLDTNFGSNGAVFIPIGNGAVANAVTIQPSNSYIVIGGSAVSSGLGQFAASRLDTSGNLDINFGDGSGIVTTAIDSGNSQAKTLALRSDEKIILGGNANDKFALAQYDTLGNLDTDNFGTNGTVVLPIGVSAFIASIAIDSSNNIVAAGRSDINIAVAVFQANGSLNIGFNNTGYIATAIGNNAGANSLVVQSNNKIVVGGFSDNISFVARYNTDGSFDSNFGSNGVVLTAIGNQNQYNGLSLQSNGKIITGGFSDASLLLVRYLANNAAFVNIINPTNGSTITSFKNAINGNASLPNAQVQVLVNNITFTTVTTDSYGNWNAGTSPLLVLGSNVVTANLISNSTTVATSTNTFTVSAPYIITITSPANGSTSVTSTVSITGTSTLASANIQVLVDGNLFTTVVTDSNGNWNAGTSSVLVNGSHSITANLMSGASTIATATSNFTVNQTNTITIVTPAKGSIVSGNTTPINGTSTIANTNVYLFIDGGLFATVSTDSNGNWNAGNSNILTNGSHVVIAYLVDSTNRVRAFAVNLFTVSNGNLAGDTYSFSYDTTNQTVENIASFQNIKFSNALAVSNNWTYNSSTQAFTAPTAGNYLISFSAHVSTPSIANTTSTTASIIVLKNGAEIPGSQATLTFPTLSVTGLPLSSISSWINNLSKTFLINLNNGDTITFQFTGNDTGIQLISSSGDGTTKPSMSVTMHFV